MLLNLRIIFMLAMLATPLLTQASVRVFACEPEWAALAHELGGDAVTITSATNALQDPHHIQARPSLIARLRRADLLVCTGAQLEIGWLPVLMHRAHNPRVQPGKPGYLLVANHLLLREKPATLDRSQGDVHPAGNPHVQLDPRNILRAAQVLDEHLIALDGGNAAAYRKRLQGFQRRWQAAMADWDKRAANLRGQSVVVHHKGWIYLLDWLGMREAGALEPIPGLPPTVAHLANLKQQLADQHPLAIIRASFQDPQPSEWLSRQTRIPAIALPFTVGGAKGADTLFGLFNVILKRLEGGHK